MWCMWENENTGWSDVAFEKEDKFEEGLMKCDKDVYVCKQS